MKQIELWVFSGRAPVLWTIPFHVVFEPGGQLATCHAALPTLQFQRDAISKRLALFGKEGGGDKWHIHPDDLEKVGRRVDEGADPQLLWSWNLPRRADEPKYKPENRLDLDEFIDSLYEAGVGESRDTLHLQWHLFCKHALDWLLNRQRPLDMYFLTLHPTPYRGNWKEILLGRFPMAWRQVSHLGVAKREQMLLDRGFLDEMIGLDLLATNPKDGYCYRRVEVEYRPAWWRGVALVEKARLAAKGACGYAQSVMDSVKRNLRSSIRLFGSYLAQISRPSVAHAPGSRLGTYRFLPHIPFSRRNVAPPPFDPVPAVLRIKQPAFTPARAYCDVGHADGPLPAVPVVQPQAADMRPPEETSTGGVPVLHAHKSPVGSQLLAGGTDGWNSGLAEGTQQPSGGV